MLALRKSDFVDYEAPQAEWRRIHVIADAAMPSIMASLMRALTAPGSETRWKLVEARLAAGDAEGAVAAVDMDAVAERLQRDVWPKIWACYVRAGSMVARLPRPAFQVTKAAAPKSKQRGLAIAFDETNPAAKEWARQQSSKLITEVTEQTRQGVRKIVTSAFAKEVAPRELSKQIRKVVGLHSRQVDALVTQRERLTAQGFEKDVIERRMEFAAAKALRYRSMNIARTETMDSSNAGQIEAWRQGMLNGAIDPGLVKEFIVTPDDRLCPQCEQYDGEQVAVNANFSFGKPGPTVHASCRCAVGLAIPSQKGKTFVPGQDYGQGAHGPLLPTGDAITRTANFDSWLGSEMDRLGTEYTGLKNLQLKGGYQLHEVDFLPANLAGKGVQATGVYQTSSDTIHLTKTFKGFLVKDEYVLGEWATGKTSEAAFRHELGHHVYTQRLGNNRKKFREIYEAMTAAEREAVSKYGASSAVEMFAESFQAYVHPQYGIGGRPLLPKQLHDFFEKHVGVRKIGGIVQPKPVSTAIDELAEAVLAPKPAVIPPPVVEPPIPFKVPAKVGTPDWLEETLQNQLSGAKGSNPGGLYQDVYGQRWYVKQYKEAGQAQSEHLANQIYKDLGLDAPESVIVDRQGQTYFASKWMDDVQGTVGQVGLTPETAQKVLDGFAADVFTVNWDAVGTGLDNIVVRSGGKVARIDQGGTLFYRAQGAPKPTSALSELGEWDSLYTKNTYYRQVFEKAGLSSADNIIGIEDQLEKITQLVKPYGNWYGYVEAKFGGKLTYNEAKKYAELLETRAELLSQKLTHLKQLKAVASAPKPVPIPSASAVTVQVKGVTPEQVEQIWALYKQKKSSYEIGAALGIKDDKVRKTIRARKAAINGVLQEVETPQLPWPIADDVIRSEGRNYPSTVRAHYDQFRATQEEYQALKGYTGSLYRDINTALRGGAVEGYQGKEAYLNYGRLINNAIERAPKPPPPELVWRGIRRWRPETTQPGAVIELNGLQSTSINPNFANSWGGGSGGTFLEIKPKRGIYVDHFSANKGESEYILPHGAKYRVIGQKQIKLYGGYHVDVIQLEML